MQIIISNSSLELRSSFRQPHLSAKRPSSQEKSRVSPGVTGAAIKLRPWSTVSEEHTAKNTHLESGWHFKDVNNIIILFFKNYYFSKKISCLQFQSAKLKAITNFMSVMPPPHWLPQMPIENMSRWWNSFWRHQQFVSYPSVSSQSCCLIFFLHIILNVHSMFACAQRVHVWSVAPHFLRLWQTEGGKEAHSKLINVSRLLPSYGSLLVAVATPALDIVQNERRAGME